MNNRTCSVIMNDRNDNHKEHNRVKYSIPSIVDIFDEIIFVDWKSPTDRGPLLHEFIDYIPKCGKVKNIIINESQALEIMEKLEIPKNFNVFIPETAVRNIALRRTTCDYVSSISGIDTFGPTKTNFQKMLSGLQDDTFYTLSRRELDRTTLYDMFQPHEWVEALNYFTENSSERRFYGGCTMLDWFSIINCCGDFQIANRNIWTKIKGFEEKMYLRCFGDTNIQKKAILNRFKVEAIFSPPTFHISHDEHASESMRNNPIEWVDNFSKTKNDDTWGFSNMNFEVEII